MERKDTGTQIPPPADTGTKVPSQPGTGTAVPPPSGTGTAVAPPSGGTGTGVPQAGAAGQPRVGSLSMIPEYPEYVINGRRYTVCKAETARTLSKNSGESKIFVVENGGNKFVIKLYIPGHSPNHDILDEVQRAGGGFMINLRDHGRWADPSHPGLMLDYEIMDYAPYGSLADMRFGGDERLLRDVAWRMAFCIKQCHDHHILHRDVKPENFLFIDSDRKQFVISDFGIARSLSGKGPVKVDTAKSSYFVSPEGSMSSKDRTTYVDCPTDYYSMGMTLLALWVGLDNFYNLFPYDNLEELDRLKLNNKVISELGDMLRMTDYTRSLLERLLEAGDQNRAGFDEIKRWYEGETLKTGAAAEAAASKSAFHVVFDETKGKVARSREELAAMMMADIEFAKSFIYRGMAKNALQASFPRLAAEIDDIPQRLYPRPDEQSTGVYAACLVLDESMAFIDRKGHSHSTARDIAAALWADRTYYAVELKKKASWLWAFLSLRGGKLRDEVDSLQAVCARSGMHGLYALCRRLDPTMGLDDSKGRPLKDHAALAGMLWGGKGTYALELANPDHSVWVHLRGDGSKDGPTLARTYPERIRKQGEAALYALCLELDPQMPYYGKSANACKTEKEVADELWAHFDKYCKELSDPQHLLWQYMRTWNASWRKVADSYPSLIASRGDEHTFDLIYRLDNTKPFTVQYISDKKWHSVTCFDDICEAISKHGLTPFSLETMTRRHFITWLTVSRRDEDRKRGVMLDDMVKRAGSAAKDRAWYFIYTLVPDRGLLFEQPGSGIQSKTASEIGYCINAELNGQSKWNVSLVDMLKSDVLRSSRLAQYLEARKMSNYVDGIAKILDIQSNINAHKSAPYDLAIAQWKVVAYMGWCPTYFFPRSRKHADSVTAVSAMPLAERNEQADKGLTAFLTTLFHERKGRPFTFDKLAEYYDWLKVNVPGCQPVKRAAAVEQRNSAAIRDRDKAWRSLRRTRLWVMLLCLLPMLFIVACLVGMAFSDGKVILEQAFVSIGTVLAVIICVIAALGGLAEGGLIGGVVAGLLGYWIPFWLFKWLSPAAPWLLSALMLGSAAYFAYRLNKKTTDRYIRNRQAYKTLVDQARMDVVCTAFGTKSRTFGSASVSPESSFNGSRDVARSCRKNVRKAAIGMIVVTLVSIAIGVVLADKVRSIETDGYGTTAAAVLASDVAGDYSGTFHGRDATMTVTRMSGGLYGEFEGSVKIMYSTPMTQQVTGRYNDGTLELSVKGNPSASYTGRLDRVDGTVTYDGTYTNRAKGTSHTFSFKKI
ncbi:MAG: protein kinase [Bacteroidales bacterium]|nr:protein kinase [Bacteroidales bacterium]